MNFGFKFGGAAPRRTEIQQGTPSQKISLEKPSEALIAIYEKRKAIEYVLYNISRVNNELLKASLVELMTTINAEGGSEEGYQMYLKTNTREVSH